MISRQICQSREEREIKGNDKTLILFASLLGLDQFSDKEQELL